jgi:hypothetical protein
VIGRLRWLGLLGAALLATGGYLAGALPGGAPASQAEALWGTGPEFRVGLAAYLAGLVLLGWAWWRLRDAWRRGEPPDLRWMLVTGGLWALPLLVAPPLGSRDLYAYACQGVVWLDGHNPYDTGAAGGGCPWLAEVPPLWQDATAPYGPLALLASVLAVAFGRAVANGDAAQLLVALGGLRLAALVGALLVAAYAPRLARACGVDPAAAAWLGLVTPLVAVHVVAGGHNDALVAGLVVAGLALAATARQRSQPVAAGPARSQEAAQAWPANGPALAAGGALGLAVAVKVTALAAVPFAALLVLGPVRRWGRAVMLVAAAVAAFAALTLLSGLGTGWAPALVDTGALAQWTSLPTGLGMAAGYVLRGAGLPGAYDPAVAVARVIGLAALVVVAVSLLVRAWRRVDDARAVVAAAGVVLAAVVVLGPVVYPWYAVTPLAVLAAATVDPRVRTWLAGATLLLTALVLPSGLGVPVLTKFPGAMLVAAAAVLLSWWWARRWRHQRPVRSRAGRRRPATAGPPRGPRAPAR